MWGLLNSTPVYPKAVPSHSLKSLGFRAKCATQSKKTEKVHRQLDKPPSFDKDYEYVFPTFEAVYRRTERFDRPVPVYDAATVKRWTGHLQREYSTIGRTHVRDFDNLYIRPDAAVGPLADSCCRRTDQLLKWYGARCWTYWDNAVNEGWPVFWKTAGKVEMLPKGKEPRTFVFCDKFMGLCFSRVTSEMNDLFKEDRHMTPSAVGMSIYGAEYISIAQKLDRFPIKIMGDVSEWDARYNAMQHDAVRDFRVESMQDWYGREWLRYKYDTIKMCLMFLPTGELVVVDHGQISGQDSTTVDNTFGHTCLVCDARDDMKKIDPGFQLYVKLYSDDIILGCTNEAFAEHLKRTYVTNSFVVKEGAFKIQRELDGLTFLGGKFRKCQTHGVWTYVPSKKKLLESLHSCVEELDDFEFYNKMFSLFILGFHTKWREVFRDYYLRARRLLGETVLSLPGKTLPVHWTDADIEAFVHGFESAGELDRNLLHFDPARGV